MSDDEIQAVNAVQESPTELTGELARLYWRAKDTINRWDPFRGVTVKAMEEN